MEEEEEEDELLKSWRRQRGAAADAVHRGTAAAAITLFRKLYRLKKCQTPLLRESLAARAVLSRAACERRRRVERASFFFFFCAPFLTEKRLFVRARVLCVRGRKEVESSAPPPILKARKWHTPSNLLVTRVPPGSKVPSKKKCKKST